MKGGISPLIINCLLNKQMKNKLKKLTTAIGMVVGLAMYSYTMNNLKPEQKLNQTSKVEQKVRGSIEGLLIGYGYDRSVKLYDFNSKKLETLAENLSGTFYSFAYHNNELWIGQGNPESGIGTLNNQLFDRPYNILSLFTHKEKLFDAGAYGIRETLTGKEHISKKLLKNKGIATIDNIISHNGKLLALVESENRSHKFYEIQERKGKLYLGKVYQKNSNVPWVYQCLAVSIHGKLITMLKPQKLDIDGAPSEETYIKNGEYKGIAFDDSKDILYVGACYFRPKEVDIVERFKIKNENGSLKFERLEDLVIIGKDVSHILDYSFTLYLLTKEQMEIIKRAK